MAVKSFAAFCMLIFALASCQAKPENCSEVRCKLLAVGERFPSEFCFKAAEKGVRMVYLNLAIGNDTYHPLRKLEDEFLPEEWVWAKSTSEPMLSFPYFYDIFSLGLLRNQVRHMDVQLEDQPRGCLANLMATLDLTENRTIIDCMVGKALLNVTKCNSRKPLHEADAVCVGVIDEDSKVFPRTFEGNVKYHCCNYTTAQRFSVQCEVSVESNGWFLALYVTLYIFAVVSFLYCPAILVALPDSVFKLEEMREKMREMQQLLGDTGENGQLNPHYGSTDQCSNNNVPCPPSTKDILQVSSDVSSSNAEPGNQRSPYRIAEKEPTDVNLVYLDDASPITCSDLLRKYTKDFPDLISFNVQLAFLWYCVILIFCFIELGLRYELKTVLFDELGNKTKAIIAGPAPLLSCILPDIRLVMFIIAFVPLPFILYSSPKDFLLTKKCCVCGKESDRLIGEEILHHMKELQLQTVCKFTAWLVKHHKELITSSMKCCRRPPKLRKRPDRGSHWFLAAALVPLEIICNFIIVILFGLFLGAVYFCLFLVGLLSLCFWYSPFLTIFIARYGEGTQITACFPVLLGKYSAAVCRFLVVFLKKCALACSLLAVCLVGEAFCRIIVKMFGFTVMGLVLNANIAGPFVTFFFAALTDIYLCYYNLQMRYQDVKQMISQKWQERNKDNLSKFERDTIPEQLFWYICGEDSNYKKALPIIPEIYRMLRNMTLIFVFLFVTFCSIQLLENNYDGTAVASTIAVLVSGIIPGLFFRGLTRENQFTGSTRKKMVKEIERAVDEYIKKTIKE